MQRLAITPRPYWEDKIREAGLIFHETPEGPYWNESVCYQFTADEVDLLEEATNELHELCLTAVRHVISRQRWQELAIPWKAAELIEKSFAAERDFSLYGRFDLAYDGDSPPQLLEYNADTPTMLLEASVVQWYWLEEKQRGADQFNSLHERLLQQWAKLKWQLKSSPLYFTYASGSLEDQATVAYLMDTADQAGLRVAEILVEDIGWDHDWKKFVDLEEQPLGGIFKLYPWEWLLQEEFGPYLLDTYSDMQWLEPLWKLVLSDKGILPILWELNPGHPHLLPSFFTEPADGRAYVRKPRFSREGANVVRVDRNGSRLETPGSYGQEGFIYQDLASLPNFSGFYPVIGSWIIGGEAGGMGIRETATPVTDRFSRFVPHFFS